VCSRHAQTNREAAHAEVENVAEQRAFETALRLAAGRLFISEKLGGVGEHLL
jgi:hypothetical protein